MIYYRSGFKYQLDKNYDFQLYKLEFLDGYKGDYFSVTKSGFLTIFRGYAWDGPSGPTIDTDDFMRGSLIHDVLYQLLGLGVIKMAFRRQCDKILQDICLEDGMLPLRAWYVYNAVRMAGGNVALARDPPARFVGRCQSL